MKAAEVKEKGKGRSLVIISTGNDRKSYVEGLNFQTSYDYLAQLLNLVCSPKSVK